MLAGLLASFQAMRAASWSHMHACQALSAVIKIGAQLPGLHAAGGDGQDVDEAALSLMTNCLHKTQTGVGNHKSAAVTSRQFVCYLMRNLYPLPGCTSEYL
jgi:hypothetical protein